MEWYWWIDPNRGDCILKTRRHQRHWGRQLPSLGDAQQVQLMLEPESRTGLQSVQLLMSIYGISWANCSYLVWKKSKGCARKYGPNMKLNKILHDFTPIMVYRARNAPFDFETCNIVKWSELNKMGLHFLFMSIMTLLVLAIHIIEILFIDFQSV